MMPTAHSKPSSSPRARCATPLLVCLMLLWSTPAWAFCGFYVSGAAGELRNKATRVALMRHGKTTVQSMQNSYEGPPQDFAMVVPVPVVLQKDQVKTLPHEIFERLERLSTPRLVEYWEHASCPVTTQRRCPPGESCVDTGGGKGATGKLGRGKRWTVQVKAQFEVGEYEIVILSAKESSGLERWLKQNKYNIPKGAAKALRPYIQQGMYFFVARVNVQKVKRGSAGRYTLSPLRFHYQSDEFTLPVRLGLLNARGEQDLIVYVLAGERYEAANAPNVTIPTNLIVGERTRERFGQFYATLFDRVTRKNPGAVVTEYSWDASSCDPCPGPTLNASDYSTLGADVVTGGGVLAPKVTFSAPTVKGALPAEAVTRVFRARTRRAYLCYEQALSRAPSLKTSGVLPLKLTVGEDGRVVSAVVEEHATLKDATLSQCMLDGLRRMRFPSSKQGRAVVSVSMSFASTGGRPIRRGSFGPNGWTLTRLHTRHNAKTRKDDLVFKKAAPLVGGVGMPQGRRGVLNTQVANGYGRSRFQARYVILHPRRGAAACAQPYYSWGGPLTPPNPHRNSPLPKDAAGFTPKLESQWTSLRTALTSEPKPRPKPKPHSKPLSSTPPDR